MTDIICTECNKLKLHYSKGLCNVCWQRMYGTPKRYHDETCEILTEHAEQHKDDGDKLSTDFILDQIELLRKSKT